MSFTKFSPVLTTLKKRIKSALKHLCSEVFPLWGCRAYCTVSCRGQTGPVVYQAVLYLSPQEGSRPFISSRLGCFQSRLKPQHLLPPLSPPPRLPDKTFRRLLLAFVLYSSGWKVPHHRPPLRPIALFVYCCDKRGKLIRR